jgi:RNA polymerase sigma-70 factor (ECF subfamily)
MGKRQRIEAVLAQMPDTLKIPLVMRDLDGMSYQEIADELSLGLSAVKMRIKRGREEFRRLFGSRAEEETPARPDDPAGERKMSPTT